MQRFSLHTHTIGFDGRNSIEEMVAKAKKLRWSMIGISNHFILHPNIKKSEMYKYACKGGYQNIYSENFDEALDKFFPLYEEITRVEKETCFPIYKGMEVDFFDNPEWAKKFWKAKLLLKPDYVIGSTHFVEHKGQLFNTHDMKKASLEEQKQILKNYWLNIRKAIQFGQFDFMAHLDLPSKVGLGQGSEWKKEEETTVALLAAHNGRAEINTGAFARRGETSPSMRILKLLAKYEVPVLLSDDAHSTDQLGWYYEQATQKLKEAGLTHSVYPIKVAKHITQRIYTDWYRQRIR